jgi:tetratricopeptide (TPR) repeat protein
MGLLFKDSNDWQNKGIALANQNRYEEAIGAYNQAIQLNPKDALAWNNKGIALLSLNRYKEAISVFDHAIQLNPKDASAWNNKGITLADMKQYEEAISALDQSIQLNPNDALPWRNKGNVHTSLNCFEEANDDFDQAIELNPNDAWAWTSKGFALLSLNSSKEALAAYIRATQLDPNNAVAWISKGITLAGLNRYEEAISAYNQAIQLDPNNALIWCNKGTALSLLNQYDEANAAYVRALKIDPDNKSIKEEMDKFLNTPPEPQLTETTVEMSGMMEHMFCQNCGFQLVSDDSLFCSRCGTKVCDSSSPQKKSVENNQTLTLNEIEEIFFNFIHALFDDVDKLDEITTIKVIIKAAENDLKKTEGYSREFRTNRILIIQEVLSKLGFDIENNTIEYLYDSIISDMDLHKIPNHKMLHYEFETSVKKDESGTVFYEIMCPACDKNIRFEIAEERVKECFQWNLICPFCSYKADISQSCLIKN